MKAFYSRTSHPRRYSGATLQFPVEGTKCSTQHIIWCIWRPHTELFQMELHSHCVFSAWHKIWPPSFCWQGFEVSSSGVSERRGHRIKSLMKCFCCSRPFRWGRTICIQLTSDVAVPGEAGGSRGLSQQVNYEMSVHSFSVPSFSPLQLFLCCFQEYMWGAGLSSSSLHWGCWVHQRTQTVKLYNFKQSRLSSVCLHFPKCMQKGKDRNPNESSLNINPCNNKHCTSASQLLELDRVPAG